MTRTLIVGPVGHRPWIPVDELAESIRALGREVVVNGHPDDVLPMPSPLPTRKGSVANTLPALGLWFLRMILAWRRSARRGLAAAHIDDILVWDEVVAVLCRLARPRGAKVLWVEGPPEGTRLYQRVRRSVVRRAADRVITSVPLVPMLGPDTAMLDGWVVLGTHRPFGEDALQRLRDRARLSRPLAVVFDERAPDQLRPEQLEVLVRAVNPHEVIWTAGDEWIDRLDGVPCEGFDPADECVVDHRHLRLLGANANVYVASKPSDRTLVRASLHPSNWRLLGLVEHTPRIGDDVHWAEHALR